MSEGAEQRKPRRANRHTRRVKGLRARNRRTFGAESHPCDILSAAPVRAARRRDDAAISAGSLARAPCDRASIGSLAPERGLRLRLYPLALRHAGQAAQRSAESRAARKIAAR